MNLLKASVVVLAVFVLAATAFSASIEGIEFPDTLTTGGQELVFNGAGYRSKFGWQVYVAGLYLKHKSSDAAGILLADEPMDIRLQITSAMVTPGQMKEATVEAFKKSTKGNIAPLAAKLDAFIAVFKDLRNHDVYDFGYVPGKGVEVLKNGTAASVIEGLDFKRALYGIWLGEKPIQDDLKARMLGK